MHIYQLKIRRLLLVVPCAVCLYLFACLSTHTFQTFIYSDQKGSQINRDPDKFHVCINIHGRLGNQLFMYAIAYSIHKKYGHILHADVKGIRPYFTITDQIYQFPETVCPKTLSEAVYDIGFDKRVLKHADSWSLHLNGYFQSYKYWHDMLQEIRKEIRFKPGILRKAEGIFRKQILRVQERDTVYVGIHVRRGDITTFGPTVEFGYLAANESYLHKAMKWFEKKYKVVRFALISDNMDWSKKAIGDKNNVVFVSSKRAEVDMAVLTFCDHTIMTTGTFGWWVAFLTDGTTLYYTKTRLPNSGLDNVTSKNDFDFFFPRWIGLS